MDSSDTQYLRRCFELAENSAQSGFRPFAALITLDGKWVVERSSDARAWHDPSAHPEIDAIREFAAIYGRQAFNRATLYSNVEPCPMCAGAVYYASPSRLVFGVSRERFDATVAAVRGRPRRVYQGCRGILSDQPSVKVVGPMLEEEGVLRLSLQGLAPLKWMREVA